MHEDRLTDVTSLASRPGRPAGGRGVLRAPAATACSYREREDGSVRMARRSRQRKPRAAVTIPPPGVPFTAVIMFIDIRNSTALTNQLGIMPMAGLMTGFFTSAAALVESEGGSIRSLNGDGALALFLGPRAADRSLFSAIRIQELAFATTVTGAAADHRSGGRSLTVGIGIDQGLVCQAVIPCSTAPQQSWVGVNTANKLASTGRPAPSIAMTKEVFTDIADRSNSARMVQCTETTVRIGDMDRVVRTLTAQPSAGPC
jgi:class 3 adenylate cyclase